MKRRCNRGLGASCSVEKKKAPRHRFPWQGMKWTLSECRKDTAVSLFNSQTSCLCGPPARESEGTTLVIFQDCASSFILYYTMGKKPEHSLRHSASIIRCFTVHTCDCFRACACRRRGCPRAQSPSSLAAFFFFPHVHLCTPGCLC